MIPFRFLDVTLADGRVRPAWLTADDEPWIGVVQDALRAAAGRPADAFREVFVSAVLPLARRYDVSSKRLGALCLVERKRWTTRIGVPVDPLLARGVVFELAAALPRAEALAQGAALLGVPADVVEQALFADRAAERLLVLPETMSTPAELVRRYNGELVETLLARAVEVTATVYGGAREIVLRAKRAGLVVETTAAEDGVRIGLSGPLALFRDTVKYGAALARFVPAVTEAPGGSLVVRVSLPEGTGELALDPSSPPFALAARAQRSGVVRRLEEDLASTPWRLEPCERSLAIDGRLFYPDAAIVCGKRRVLLEIVSGRSADHVTRARAVLDKADTPVLLCVEQHEGEAPAHPAIVRYRTFIDAWAIASAAERLSPASSSSLPRAPP